MKQIIAVGMAGVLAAAVCVPRPATAGQKEWATAGKILTGVVVAGLLADACMARPAYVQSEVTVTRPVYERRVVSTTYHPRPHCTFVRPAPRVIVERQVVVQAPPPPPPPPPRTEPIVIYQADGRRLYQPPVHGHKAFIQVYSEMTGEWVSIKEHPSIW
jgi:hypothetical protein